MKQYNGSYNLERASTFMQNVSIENVSITYSVANELKYDISDATGDICFTSNLLHGIATVARSHH